MEAVLTQSRMQQSHQTLGKSWCHRVGIGWVASSPSLDMLSNTAFCVWYSFMYGRELIEKGTECFSSKSMLQILNQCKSTFSEAQFHKTIPYKTSHKMQATLLSVFWFARQGHARLTVAPPRSNHSSFPTTEYCWILLGTIKQFRLHASMMCALGVNELQSRPSEAPSDRTEPGDSGDLVESLWILRILLALPRDPLLTALDDSDSGEDFCNDRLVILRLRHFATLHCFCSVQVKAVCKTTKKSKKNRKRLQQSSPRHPDSLDSGMILSNADFVGFMDIWMT